MIPRRLLLAGLASGMAGLGISGALAHDARYVYPYRPVLERITLSLPAAHANLAGLRLGFVTDTHVGPYFTAADLARATALLAAERPDLILLGGDFVSESPRYAGPAAEALGEVVGQAPLGGYAVLGNHDYSNGAAKVAAALAHVGVDVLRNQATRIATGRGDLWLAGVDDTLLSVAKPEATFAAIPPESATLALWHEPEYADRTAALAAFAQLSGHSHGGQVRLPAVGALVVPNGGRRYVMGLNQAGAMPVYTSRGVGVFRPPVRLNCPPEVTLVTLVARE